MNWCLIQVLKLCVLAPPLPHDDFVWCTTVMYFPGAIKINRQLVPASCIWPSGGSYLSSSCRMRSFPCFAEGCTNVEPRCFVTAVLRNEISLPFSLVLLLPALINCYALHSCKSHCKSTVVALCVAGSWSWSVTGHRLFLKLSGSRSSSFASPILQGFCQWRIPAIRARVKLQSRKDWGRISRSQGCQTTDIKKLLKLRSIWQTLVQIACWVFSNINLFYDLPFINKAI